MERRDEDGPLAIDHVALRVRDIGRSIVWYREVVGLRRRGGDPWKVPVFICGQSGCISLFDAPRDATGIESDTIAMDHVAFRLDREGFDRARQRLSDRGIEYRFRDHVVQHSIYFFDPDGHEVELTTYDV